MKKSTTYFGNRFKTALQGIRNRRSRAVTVAPAVASEFEALESRILLSGLTTGTRVYKSISFTDADGDKVSIKVLGNTGARAGFQLDSGFSGSTGPTGADIGQLNLVGLTSSNSLLVTVKPSKLQATDKTTSNNLWSPGYTNIGQITSEASTNGRGQTLTAAAEIRNITLNAAVVSDINLIDTDIAGNLQLGVGRTAFADRSNIAAVFGDTNSYNPVAGLVDFYDISAKSIGQLTLNGVIAADANNPFAPGSDTTNDFLGNINIVGDLGGIIGLRSSLDGILNVGGDLGKISVGQINSDISVGGDAVFSAPAGFDGSFVAGGHLHLGLNSGNPGDGNFYAGAGISGLNPASEVDTILVPALFTGSLNNSSSSLAVGAGIANISVTGGAAPADFDIFSGNSVGNITGAALGAMNVSAVTSIGNLTTTAGALDGTYTAGTTIGNITATNANGDGILGSFTAGTSIGNINATVTGAGDAIYEANFTAGTTIGTITALVSGPTGGTGINGDASESTFNANSGIGAISVTVNGVGEGINKSTFNADADGDLVGSLATITVVHNSTGGDAIGVSEFSGASIGNISVTLNKVTALNGVYDSSFTATAGDIGTVTVSSKGGDAINKSQFDATGNIGVIIATALTGDGIDNGDFTADSDGDLAGALSTITVTTATGNGIANGSSFSGTSIGAISAKVTGNGGFAIGGTDVDYTTFNATTGSIGTIQASAANGTTAIEYSDFNAKVDIGAITATGGANYGTYYANFTAGGNIVSITATADDEGIYESTFTADGNIGDINAEGGDDGIDESTFIAVNGSIGNVTAEGLEYAIGNSTFKAGTNIGNILATGVEAAIENSTFTAVGNIGNVTATAAGANGDAIAKFENLGEGIFAGGNIGNIIISATSPDATASAFFGAGDTDAVVSAGGNIGNITVTNAGIAATAHGLEDVKIDVTGTMGVVSITTAGGIGMVDSSIDPSSIASVTIVSPDVAMDNADIISTGTIGTINVTGDVVNGSLIEAETDFTGPINITGELKNSTIRSNTGDITGPISITEGIADSSTIEATDGNIGAITTPSIDGSTIQIGAEGTLGDLTVNATGGKAVNNLSVAFTAPLPGVEATASLGKITVTNTGTNLTDTGITNSTFNAGGYGTGIDDITVTVAGGVAVETVNFLAPYIAANPTASDEGLFVTPISAYSVDTDTAATTNKAPLPTSLTGNIEFSTALNHTRVDGNGGFPTWNSSGGVWGDTSKGNIYDGDVYATTGNNVTLDLVPGVGESSVGKLIFYVLGTDPINNDFRITLPGGEELILEDVSFATAVEVTATDVTATALTTITVESGTYNPSAPVPWSAGGAFGIGEFSATAAATPALPAGSASIGDITVVNTGGFASSSGLVNVIATAAIDIGKIDVTVGTNVAFPLTTSGGDGIANSNFTAQSGKIGTIDVVNTSADTISDGIFNSKFIAAGEIGNIDVSAVGGNAIFGSNFIADSDTSKAGDIGTITAATAKGFGIENSTFQGANIGNIDAKVTGDGFDAIDSSFFTALSGNIGTVKATTAATTVSADAIDDSTFSATGNIGALDASTTGLTGGDGIDDSSFYADSDKSGAGDIVSITATSVGESGIQDSTFIGANVGNILSTVTGDGEDGINDGVFTAKAGNIGTVTATTAGTGGSDDAIYNSVFSATGDIGAIDATAAAGTGIEDSNFAADSDINSAGEIISITAESATGTGIRDSKFTGANIGNIEAKVTGDGNDGITGGTFTSTGNIGDINVQSNGTSPYSDYGIVSSTFTANGNIGLTNGITVTTVGGSGIAYSTFKADSDSASGGDIGAVDVTTAESDAIYDSNFSAVNIGDISAVHTGTGSGGGDGIDDSSFIATGNIGNINASTAGTDSDDGAIENSTFDAKGNIGNLTATAVADHTVDFSAGGGIFADGNIGNITVSMTGTTGAFDAILGSGKATTVIEAKGNLGDITITNDSTDANADGLDNVKVDVTGTLGTVAITATGGAAMRNSSIDPSSITAVTLTGDEAMNNSEIISTGTIGNVTLNGDVVATSTLKASTSIGNITGTGKGDSSITVDAPTIGNINFNSIEDAEVTLTVLTATKVGDIRADAPAGKQADLDLTALTVTSFGDIVVDGVLTLNGGGLAAAKTIGDFTVDEIFTAGASKIGAGAGASIGFITIVDTSTAGSNTTTFQFANYDGQTSGTTPVALVDVVTDIAPDDMPITPNAGDITFQLI